MIRLTADSYQRSSASAVIVVQSTQDGEGEDLTTIVIWRDRLTMPFWNLLFEALMRSSSIEVLDIGMQDTMQLLLQEDEKVIETLSTHAAQKPFTDRIGSWWVVRRGEHLDAAGCGYASETGSKFAITIANEIVRRLSIGSRLPQLLGGPGVGRRSWRCVDTHMDDFTKLHIDNEEGKQRAKEEVCDLQEITRPDVLRMVLQESGPVLSSPSWRASMPHVLLNGAFGDADAQLE